MAKALVEHVLGEGEGDRPTRTCPAATWWAWSTSPCSTFVEPRWTSKRLVRGGGQLRHHGPTAPASSIIAPAFGEDDARVCRENGLPFVQLVDTQGCLAKETPWAGMFVKDADPLILEDLKERGLLFAALPFTHDYPFCWRCDTPLHLLRPRHLVHQDDRRAGQADAATTAPSTGCPTTSRKAAWATSWKTSSTGACPASATGARPCPCGSANAATCTSSAPSRSCAGHGP